MNKTIYRKPGVIEITRGFDFCYQLQHDFYERLLIFSLIYFTFYINLPLPKSRGVYYFGRGLWFVNGKNKKKINMPWQWEIKENKVLTNNMAWKDFDVKNITEKKGYKIYRSDYFYTLKSGEVQKVKAKFHVERHRFCWKCFLWLGWPYKERRIIDVSFDKPIGEEVDTWKGGCVGCSFDMKKNELPVQALRRMEREEKF